MYTDAVARSRGGVVGVILWEKKKNQHYLHSGRRYSQQEGFITWCLHTDLGVSALLGLSQIDGALLIE